VKSVLEKIRDLLEPERIRKHLNVFIEEREHFLPRCIITDSYDEMITELCHFYMAAQNRWFHSPGVWTFQRAHGAVIQILNTRLGNKQFPKMGEYSAMAYANTGDRGGVAYLLDVVMDVLVSEGLRQYVDFRVMPLLQGLAAEELMALASAYFDDLAIPGGRVIDSPASLALRFRQIITEHARLAFYGGPPKAP